MAQPHKGDREQLKVRAPFVVYEEIRRLAAERRTSMSQVAADLLSLAVGHPEAVAELHDGVMQLAI